MADADGLLLVIGSGPERYREYLLESARQLAPLWLFETQEDAWHRRQVAGVDILDVFDAEQVVRRARELAAVRPVAGVLCYHEAAIHGAALAARELGAAGPDPEAVAAVRDKRLTRRLLTEAGIAQPRFAAVPVGADPAAAAEALGYPLVAKPPALGASQGVVKVQGPADLDRAARISREAAQTGMARHDEILLEQYLAGPEISVDAAVFEGEYLPYLVAHKQVGGEPYFEEVGHVVRGDEPLLADPELVGMLADAHRALGYTHGLTHTEVKLTPGGPVIVEVNGRIGGDLIPYVGRYANGVDTGTVAAQVYLGQRPDAKPAGEDVVAIRFLYPPVNCTVRGVTLPPADPGAGLVESVRLVEPGTRLLVQPDGVVGRYAYLIARGSTVEECEAILDRAERAASVDADPLPAEG